MNEKQINQEIVSFITDHITANLFLDEIDFDKLSESEILSTKLISSNGIDSLDKIELIIACETSFDINIPDIANERIKTIEDLRNEIYLKIIHHNNYAN